MSLWRISDEATRDLMVSFYRSLKTGVTRSDALRAARIEIRGIYGDHPYAWASFIMGGAGWEALDLSR
jgi:CHAT domain-containing protein